MADETQPQNIDEHIKGMMEANSGATPAAAPASAPVVADDGDLDDGQLAPEKAPDPWEQVHALGKPEEVLAKLKDADRVRELEDNSKAYRREASLRGEQTAREKQEIESIKAEIRAAYEGNQALVNMAATLRQEGNDALALQLLDVAAKQAGSAARSAHAPTTDGIPSAVAARLEAVERSQQQYAFGDGHARLTEAAVRAVSSNALFQKPTLQRLGVADKAIENIVQNVIARAQREPNAVNIWDIRSVNAAVDVELKKEVSYQEQLRNGHINDYRIERKARNAQAPPTGRGPTAGVRSAPGSQNKPPANASRQELEDYFVKEMIAAGAKPRQAMES